MGIKVLSCFFAALLLSGCLGIGLKDVVPVGKTLAPAVEPLAPQMLKVRDLLKNTTCEPSAAMGATSPNMKQLGQYRSAGGGGLITIGTPATAYAQIDTWRNRTAISSPTGTSFVILNTTDPTRPIIWSQGSSQFFAGNILEPRNLVPFTSVWDTKFSEDGTVLVAAINQRLYAADITYRGYARYHFQQGFTDMPADFGGQAYRLAIEQIGNRQYVFVSPGPTATGIAVFILAGSGYFAKFDSLGVMQFTGGQAGRVTVQPYDMVIETEYLNGENHTLMYAANGQHGLMVLDVSQPLKPEIIATIPMSTPAANNIPGAFTSIAVAKINGKRILAASQNGPQSALRLWDLTEFKTPKPLGAWTLDPSKPAQPQGELNIVNGTLFVTHFEQGLWGFDLNAFIANPSGGLKPVLHYQPPPGSSAYDVSIEDGIIQMSDPLGQSLQLAGYGCFTPGERRFTSHE